MKALIGSVAVSALVLGGCVVVGQSDGFRDRLAQGCRTVAECGSLKSEAGRRVGKCQKNCHDEEEDLRAAEALYDAAKRDQKPEPRAVEATKPPSGSGRTFGQALGHGAGRPTTNFTGECGEEAKAEEAIRQIPNTVPPERRADFERSIRAEVTQQRERRWAKLTSEIEKPGLGMTPKSNLEEALASVKAAQARLPELKCGDVEAKSLAWVTEKLDSRSKAIEAEIACRASEDCMAKRAAQPICDDLDSKRFAAKEMARERANPSGTVNLTALNELGRAIQDADERLVEDKKEYARSTKKPFNESMCKK